MMNAQPAISDEAGVVLRALQQAKQPLTADKLLKELPSAIRPSKDRLGQLLQEQVNLKQVLCGNKGKSPVYWAPNLEGPVREAMFQVLAEGPQTQSKLLGRLRTILSGWPKDRPKQILEQLVQERLIRQSTGRSPVYWIPSLEQSLREAILQALSERPQTQKSLSSQLQTLLSGWPKDQLKRMLEQLVQEGLIRQSTDKTPSYWIPSAEQQAREKMLTILAERPRPEKEFLSSLELSLSDWPQAHLKQMLEQLGQEGRLYRLPPLAGKAEMLSLQPADPRSYLQGVIQKLKDEIRQLAEKLEPAGVSKLRLFTAAHELLQQELPISAASALVHPVPDFGQLLINRMMQIEPGAINGALVSLRDLRRALHTEISDKASFDQAALQLFQQGRVDLTWHHHPSILSEEERNEMVTDGQGNYYNGIVLRS